MSRSRTAISRGALVENLTKNEVEVFEDAVPQKISFFAHSVDVPLTLGLIVDFSGSQDQFSKQHERDLQVFLKDVLGSKDRVFLVCFGNHVRLVSNFSQSGVQMMQHSTPTGTMVDISLNWAQKKAAISALLFTTQFSTPSPKNLLTKVARRALLVFSDGECARLMPIGQWLKLLVSD
jgi:Ca-activated chloride channel family protein